MKLIFLLLIIVQGLYATDLENLIKNFDDNKNAETAYEVAIYFDKVWAKDSAINWYNISLSYDNLYTPSIYRLSLYNLLDNDEQGEIICDSSVNSFLIKAALYYINNDLEVSESIVQETIERFPDNAFVLLNYGWILRNRGKSEKALIYLEQAYEISPLNTQICYILASAYLEVRDTTSAFELLNTINRYYPNNFFINLLLGDIYRAYGNYEKAENIYSILIKSHPNIEGLKERKRILNEIRNY